MASAFDSGAFDSGAFDVGSTVGVINGSSIAIGVGRCIAKAVGVVTSAASSALIGQRIALTIGVASANSISTGLGRRIAVATAVDYGASAANAVGGRIAVSIANTYASSDVYGTSSGNYKSAQGSAFGASTMLGIGRAIRSTVGMASGVASLTGCGIRIATGLGISVNGVYSIAITQMIRSSAGHSYGTSTASAYQYVASGLRLTLKATFPRIIRKSPRVIKATTIR
jgi:hypothetical protein